MRFSTIFTATMAFAFAAAQTASQITGDLDSLTEAFRGYSVVVEKISTTNLDILGPQTSQSLIVLTTVVDAAQNKLAKSSNVKLSDGDTKAVIDSLIPFVQIQQVVFGILNEKRSSITPSMLPQIARALIAWKTSVEKYAVVVISTVPIPQIPAVQKEFTTVYEILQNVIDSYKQ